jgi:transcriptional regulator with XRE-family HTH domain
VLSILSNMKNNKTKPGPPKGAKFVHLKRTEFGDRLFAITRSRKVTLKELGEQIGISKRMVTYYETNEMGPPLAILHLMASALGVTVAYLAGESPLRIATTEDVRPAVRRHIETLKKLPLQEQKPIFHMIELAAKARLTKNE